MSSGVYLLPFSPAEAERITGVDRASQRDWRRRGFLPSHDGRATFDALALAELWTRGMVSERGGPARAAGFADAVATRIVGHALAWPDAWEGDADKAPGKRWGDKARWLRREWTNIEPSKFFLWLADDSHLFAASVDAALAAVSSSDPSACGALVVLDLEALGAALLKRAGRPLAYAEYPDSCLTEIPEIQG